MTYWFSLSSEETHFLEAPWKCLKMVGTALSFSMFLGFVPIDLACKSRLKKDGSKFSEHTDSVPGINFLFRLCNHLFFFFIFFAESRWKLIFLLFAERFVHPVAPQLVIFNFFNMLFGLQSLGREIWTSFFSLPYFILLSCLNLLIKKRWKHLLIFLLTFLTL